MKQIRLTMITDKGIKVWQEVYELGGKQTWYNKKIMRSVYIEKIVSKNPFIVVIEPKLKRVAEALNIPILIAEALQKKGLAEKKDYTIEVIE